MSQKKEFKILSDLPPYVSKTWNQKVTQVKLPQISSGLLQNILPTKAIGITNHILKACSLLNKSGDHDFSVTFGSGHGLLFAMLQRLFKSRKKAIPIIFLDCLYYSYKNPIKKLIKRMQLRIAAKPNNRFVCWSTRETVNFSDYFGIPLHHFVFIPYFSTLEKEKIYSKEGDYIFSGGNSDRDYITLTKATKDLPVNVIIATNTVDWISPEIKEFANISIAGMPYDKYSSCMKESLINVVILRKGMLRSGGQQTFINSILLGKPTVICDNGECLDYIENAKSAFYVPSGDSQLLHSILHDLIINSELRKSISEYGKKSAARFNHENTMKSVLQLGEELVNLS